MRFWRPTGLALVLVATGLVYYLFSNRPAAATAGVPPDSVASSAEADEWVQLKRGDFEIICREQGEIKPVNVTTMMFVRPGKLSFLIPDGTAVKKGDKVMGLETKDLEDEVKQIQDDLAAAERTLTQAEQNRDLEIDRMANDLLAQKDAAELAVFTEKDTLSHPIPTEKEDAENGLAGAQAQLEASKADLDGYKILADNGFGTQSDLDSKTVAVAKAEVELKRSEMKLRIALAGALPYDREKSALGSQNAQLDLKIKELDTTSQTDTLTAKVDLARHAHAQLQHKLARRKSDLEHSTLLAPHDGIAVYRQLEWLGNRKLQVGERIWAAIGIVDLPIYDKMKVKTQVPESFIVNLKARGESGNGLAAGAAARTHGSPARVTINTVAGRVYCAEVTRIDSWGRDRNEKLLEADAKAQGLSGVRVFAVEVELDESDPQHLREGFQATVEFSGGMLKDMIAVPLRAITNRNGAPSVQVLSEGKREWRKIELGARSLDRVVAIAGLNDGDTILVPHERKQPAAAPKPERHDEPLPVQKDKA